jgi:hypothetical protein
MAARVHKEFQVKLTLAELFKNVTIRQLAQCIKNKKQETYLTIAPAPGKPYYDLSPAQKRLYVLQQISPHRIDYNMPLAMMLDGDLDIRRLELAFNRLVQRHEILRTAIEIKNDRPVQVIRPEAPVDIEYIRYPLVENGEIPPPEELEPATRDFVRPFDLSQPPLLRVRLVKTGEAKHILIVDMHHIVTDAISSQIAAREFLALYTGQELPPPRLQYKDFSEWQNNLLTGAGIKKQEQYWLQQFAGEIPRLNLPLDYPRPAVRSYESGVTHFTIEPELASRLNALNSKIQTTPYMLLLAVYNILLARYSEQQDIIVGSAAAGRRHPDLENIMGMFVNMLAMRNQPLEDLTFAQFLEQVKINALNAYENQDYQFDQLIKRLGIDVKMDRNPLFDAQFTFQNAEEAGGRGEPIQTPDLTMRPYPYKHDIGPFDLSLIATESNDTFKLKLGYLTSLFKTTTGENMKNHFMEILEQCINDPGIKIKDISVSLNLVSVDAGLTESEVTGFGF